MATKKKQDIMLDTVENSTKEIKGRTDQKIVEDVVNGISKEERAKIYSDKVKTVRSQIVDAELNLDYIVNISNDKTKEKIKEYKAQRQKIKERGTKDEKVVSKHMIDNLEDRLRKNKVDEIAINQNIAEYSLFVHRLMEKAKKEKIVLDI